MTDGTKDIEKLETEDPKQQLNEALNECAGLKAENERLRQMLGQIPKAEPAIPNRTVSEPNLPFTPTASPITNDFPSKDKIALFRSLFRLKRKYTMVDIFYLYRYNQYEEEIFAWD